MGATAKLSQIRHHMIRRKGAFRDGLHHITRFGQTARARIHHQKGALQGQRISFAHIGPIGAHQIKMRPRLQRRAGNEWLMRQGGSTDDIRRTKIGLGHRPRRQAMRGKLPSKARGILPRRDQMAISVIGKQAA